MTFKSILFPENVIKDGGLRKQNISKNKDSSYPMISVITVVLNGEKYLEESIESLHVQKEKNFEHIIVDGNSNDNTVKISGYWSH